MFKTAHRLIAAGSLLVLTILSFLLAKLLPQVWFSFYPDVSKGILSVIGTVTGIFPFCLWEILLVLLLVWMIVSLVLAIKKKRVVRWLAGLLEFVAALLFVFVFSWGLNHFGPKVPERIGLSVRQYSVEELKDATVYYAGLAGQSAHEVSRDENGELLMPEPGELSARSVEAFAEMDDPLFTPAAHRVKPLLSSRLFSYGGITGIFVDLTAEPCINTETFSASLPFTVCHELSHSCAVAAEDDASFCAFLVCAASDDPLLRYSGYYSAFVYCFDALYEVDPVSAKEVREGADALLLRDCAASVEYYRQFEGPVKEVATAANDTYLKTFGESDGVRSYGAVADLLIAYWLQQ